MASSGISRCLWMVLINISSFCDDMGCVCFLEHSNEKVLIYVLWLLPSGLGLSSTATMSGYNTNSVSRFLSQSNIASPSPGSG